jgi:hypothetical protein
MIRRRDGRVTMARSYCAGDRHSCASMKRVRGRERERASRVELFANQVKPGKAMSRRVESHRRQAVQNRTAYNGWWYVGRPERVRHEAKARHDAQPVAARPYSVPSSSRPRRAVPRRPARVAHTACAYRLAPPGRARSLLCCAIRPVVQCLEYSGHLGERAMRAAECIAAGL